MPELFYVECGAVLRRRDLNGLMAPSRIAESIRELMAWSLRVTQVRGLFEDAWRLRANLTFADALDVALARHLSGDLLTDDSRLTRAPNLSVRVLSLP